MLWTFEPGSVKGFIRKSYTELARQSKLFIGNPVSPFDGSLFLLHLQTDLSLWHK